ncbi:alanine racemase domain protein [Fibrella aestuarina BUZ 2]|uniref:Pyridoxal phosphate homeostasis protein n=1 Tax=Fibrella aestuarina BUZ 2 TaxID=1166018 RepID=I0KF88_9BACT|nr:YggS family pyridoxal phosphate-dependent enzyme [Fibrella aestuarina]CCH02791.1 alanine racemase domain protein [Fibrella aestuarina BUZ 2]
MSIATAIQQIDTQIAGRATLVAVTKTKPVPMLQEAYEAGCRHFGENRVQELIEKQPLLPADVRWHQIGHLQTNKVKYIAPFISLIESVDSEKLLVEIDKQAQRHNRVIDCLLQVFIADEETKFGFAPSEVIDLLQAPGLDDLTNIRIVGLMGIATNTDDEAQVREEFRELKQLFDALRPIERPNVALTELSMGMSSDYLIALEEGSTMVRVGSAIFGQR